MKTARKPRPKSSKLFLIAFKKSRITWLIKLLLPLLCLVLRQGDTTQIYIVKAKEVKKKTKKRIMKLMIVSERIILFLSAFFALIYTIKELFLK